MMLFAEMETEQVRKEIKRPSLHHINCETSMEF